MDKEKYIKNCEELQAELVNLANSLTKIMGEVKAAYVKIADEMDRVELMHDAMKFCGVVEDDDEDEGYILDYLQALELLHRPEYDTEVKCELWDDNLLFAWYDQEEGGIVVSSAAGDCVRFHLTQRELKSKWKVIKEELWKKQ